MTIRTCVPFDPQSKGGAEATVRVAIKNGHAIGVTVSTNPPDPGVAACIDRHVRGIGWPVSSKMDTLTTNY